MNKDAEKIGVWGGTGSGKSTRVKEILRERRRVVVFDPIGDYCRQRGFHTVDSLRSLYKEIKVSWHGDFKLVLKIDRKADPQQVLEALAEGLFVVQQPYYLGRDGRKLTLVVEEMSVCYPERTLAAHETNFKQLVNLGRHYGVEIIGVSQRIAEVKKNFVGNCSQHYFFRMGAAVDVQAATRIIGNQHKAELLALDTHEFLHTSRGKVTKGKNAAKFGAR